MIRSVLVPLDNSPFSEHALPLAAGVARRAGAKLQIAHVHELPADDYALMVRSERLEAQVKRMDRAYLDGVVRRLKNSGTTAEPVLLEGATAEALNLHAAAADVDLVVMATHGRGAMGRFWFGSVADELTRHLPVPVLLIRPTDAPIDLTSLPAVNRILVPLDGSPLAEAILEPATALGVLTNAEFVLVRIVKPVVHPAYYPEFMTIEEGVAALEDEINALQKQATDEATRYLEAVAGRLRTSGLRVQTAVVVEEDVAGAVLKQARIAGADLLALATHGRGGLARLFRGSVAEKLVRTGSLPVLVYRPKVK
jgi:nucleotide-binding universal stress UspA family protein